jgi:iron complex outermembrane recepter protein
MRRKHLLSSPFRTLFAFCLFGPQMCLADGGEGEPMTIVVTATRSEKVESEAPASVSVVTEQEIENRQAQRIDEALQGVPGVFIRSMGGEQPSNWKNQITLRGVPGYYRTGVLLDGVPLNLKKSVDRSILITGI